MEIFSTRLRDLRDNSGLLSKELAKELRISESKLSNYVNGKEPDFNTLINIATYFDVTTDYLLGNSNNKNNIHGALRSEVSKKLNMDEDEFDELLSSEIAEGEPIRDHIRMVEDALIKIYTALCSYLVINKNMSKNNQFGFTNSIARLTENISTIIEEQNKYNETRKSLDLIDYYGTIVSLAHNQKIAFLDMAMTYISIGIDTFDMTIEEKNLFLQLINNHLNLLDTNIPM